MKWRFQEISGNNRGKHYVGIIFVKILIPAVYLSLFLPLTGLAAELQYKIEHPTEEFQFYFPDVTVTQEPILIGSGTGFIITKDGYIITCRHVMADANIIKVVISKKI